MLIITIQNFNMLFSGASNKGLCQISMQRAPSKMRQIKTKLIFFFLFSINIFLMSQATDNLETLV